MTRRFLQLLMLLFLPFALLVIGGALFTYSGEERRESERLQAQEATEVSLAIGSLQANFDTLFGDVVYLSEEPTLRDARRRLKASGLTTLTETYRVFAKTKRFYQHVRWIDAAGMERVRIDNIDGKTMVIPADKLQDKSGRYYFKQTMALPMGKIFISPLDLTIEHGELVKPYRPAVRAATTVHDSHGHQQGMVILNFDGKKLIDDILLGFAGSSVEHAMVLNSSGHWLRSPRHEDEWGFMLGKKNGFAERYPGVWTTIQQSQRGQFYNDEGLWTFHHYTPVLSRFLLGDGDGWSSDAGALAESRLYVVSLVPAREIRSNMYNAMFKIWGSAILLLLASLVGSWVLARVWLSRETAKAELGRLNERNILLTSIGEGVIGIDRNGVCVFSNTAASAMLHLSEAEITGRALAELIIWRNESAAGNMRSGMDGVAAMPFEFAGGLAALDHRIESNGWVRTLTGTSFPAWLTVSPAPENEGRIAAVVTLQDITELKRAEAEAYNLAYYDPLTRLPNRRMLLDRLEIAISSMIRSGQFGALVFVDVDQFKLINDSFGHQHGDHLLIELASLLDSNVRVEDTVAHLGADHFVIMLQDLAESENETAELVEDLAAKVITRVEAGMVVGEKRAQITVSIGIALIADASVKADEVLKRAELAMNQAKSAGRNTLRFFDPLMQSRIDSRVLLESEMRAGLVVGEFVPYYQPKVDMNGQIVSVEALVRWQHPVRGLVAPAEFIPVAEDSGLILVLGAQMLRFACVQLAQWAKDGVRPELSIAVNVSARQFRNPPFVDEVKAILTSSGADPKLLLIELTESMLADDIEDVIAKMNALRALGVRFSLDDFGTGYSSLSYLKRLPLYQVKIDKSFISDMLNDPNDATLVRTIIAMGKSLGLKIVAEGVETAEQWEFLRREFCDQGQGYLFSRPVAVVDLAAKWLVPATASKSNGP